MLVANFSPLLCLAEINLIFISRAAQKNISARQSVPMKKSAVHKILARLTRVFGLSTLIFIFIFESVGPALAAVPVYVVNQDAGTKFETSLESFMADLFNTLANRQEDFTASFELTKIEKAREDVNKLYQESLKELQDFGLAYDIADKKLAGAEGAGSNGAAPTISPLKGPRIIHDPFEFIFGEPVNRGRAFAACYINYLIWDQQDFLFGNNGADPKSTYAVKNPYSTSESIENLRNLKKELGVLNHYGDWYQYGSGIENEDPFIAGLFDDQNFNRVKPICERVFEITRGENIETATKDVELHDIDINSAQGQILIRQLMNLPTLDKSLVNRNDVRFEELQKMTLPANSLESVREGAKTQIDRIVNEAKQVRQLEYLAGQGLRPEYLYVTDTQGSVDPGLFFWNTNSFAMNTEYVISPAVILLQKMQAATQAQFDLAGQGFVYLDPQAEPQGTPKTILDRYRVASNSGETNPANANNTRGVCNTNPDGTNFCTLIDAWLKPSAKFRSAPDQRLISPDAASTAPVEDRVGSGLPAPFEDDSPTVSLGYNYKLQDYNYFAPTRPRRDVYDNLGDPKIGVDFSTNDWFDRVLELYESKRYDINNPSTYYPNISDWQCVIKIWMIQKATDTGIFNPFDISACR